MMFTMLMGFYDWNSICILPVVSLNDLQIEMENLVRYLPLLNKWSENVGLDIKKQILNGIRK